jgi:translation initiation factor 2B subunit (eIF-2B alpha/beta/delta family)
MGSTSPAEAVETILAEIAGDKSDGATSLALRGLDALEQLCGDLPAERDPALEQIAELAARIDAIRPSICAVGVQAVLALARTRSLTTQGLPPGAALRQAIRVERETLGQANLTIANLAAKELGSGGVFASCSWSVTAARCLVAVRPERLHIGEGHRLGDGLKAAKWLAARGLEVEVVPDAALPATVAGARAVLVGADQLLADGSVVNRCSSLSLALAAHHHGVPFIVACQRIKLGGRPSATIEESPGLFGLLPEGVTSRVPLFDLVPTGLITSVITESGVLSAAEAGEIGGQIASLRDRFIGGR